MSKPLNFSGNGILVFQPDTVITETSELDMNPVMLEQEPEFEACSTWAENQAAFESSLTGI